MKRFILTLMFAALCVGSFAQSMSSANETMPMPVVTSPIISFIAMATPTFTLGNAGTAITGLPAGTKGFIVRCTTAVPVVYGPSTVVPAEGWPMIGTASQEVFYISPARTPTIYFCPLATGTTPTIRVTPFK